LADFHEIQQGDYATEGDLEATLLIPVALTIPNDGRLIFSGGCKVDTTCFERTCTAITNLNQPTMTYIVVCGWLMFQNPTELVLSSAQVSTSVFT
jgi:hypothetical protein